MTTIQNVKGDFYPTCGEIVMNMAAGIRHSTAMLAFDRDVNAAIVDPILIIGVRQELALDQHEAAANFGESINVFSRYENGRTDPPLAMVKLFKVPGRHPEPLSEVQIA